MSLTGASSAPSATSAPAAQIEGAVPGFPTEAVAAVTASMGQSSDPAIQQQSPASGTSQPAGDGRRIPSGCVFERFFMHVVVNMFIRGPTNDFGLVWASLTRQPLEWPRAGTIDGDLRSYYKKLIVDVTSTGLENRTKDVLLDVSPLPVAIQAAFLAFARIGVPVPVPARITSVESSGRYAVAGAEFENDILVRAVVNDHFSGDIVPAVIIGANLGHEVVPTQGALAPVFSGRVSSGITAVDLAAGGPLVGACLDALKGLVATNLAVQFGCPDDIDLNDLLALAPVVSNVYSDGTPCFDTEPDSMDSGSRASTLQSVMKHFVPRRHDFAACEAHPFVLRALSFHREAFAHILRDAPSLAWKVAECGRIRSRAESRASSRTPPRPKAAPANIV